MRRQALVVALLLWGCDDSKFDPSPMQPIPHGPDDAAPSPRPVATPPTRPPTPAPAPVAAPEPPPPALPTTGTFSVSIVTTNSQAKKSWRGGLKGTAGWSVATSIGKGGPETDVRGGELGKDAATLFSRLDALNWHLLASGSGKGDGTTTVVTIVRGDVSRSFSLDGGCDCPAAEAVAAITKALGKLPAMKATTAVSSPGVQKVKNGARMVEAECQQGQCTPHGSKDQRAYFCYPTTAPMVQNCLDVPWKTKGFLVKTAGKLALEPGRKAWALMLGAKVGCELNGTRTAWVCSDGRVVREVLPSGKAWFAVVEEEQPPLPVSKVFLLPSSSL